MQKIMFNDRFLLTDAVLEGRKTQTRRLPSPRIIEEYEELLEDYKMASPGCDCPCQIVGREDFLLGRAPYKVGEIVAVAQRYSEIGAGSFDVWERESDWFKKGFSNKMFVKSELMPHQIRITKVRLQRLQEITDDECLLEGIQRASIGFYVYGLKGLQCFAQRKTSSYITPRCVGMERRSLIKSYLSVICRCQQSVKCINGRKDDRI